MFPAGMRAVHAGSSRVRRPPPRMADLLVAIAAHRDVSSVTKGLLRSIAAGGSETLRRLRRRTF